MNIQQLYEFCLSKKGVTEHFPFDDDTLVFKVGGKIFCFTSLKQWEKGMPSINLKCDPNVAISLREKYESVLPGYHSNKKHWNTIMLEDDLPDKKIFHLITHSYELVFSKLNKKIKQEILQSEN